jgi:curved DNA binding protein
VFEDLVKLTKVGSSVIDLCKKGDQFINDEVKKVANNIRYKGVAFPTCVSINEMAGFNSPKDTDQRVGEGDLVKIELGVHINGFPALVCSTVVVNESDCKINDRRADVMKAVIEASRKIIKIMKPKKTNYDIMNVMRETAKKYNVSLPIINENTNAPGVVSYQISRYVIDGYNDEDDKYIHRFIISRRNSDFNITMRKLELEENEVYAIDVLMSTGSGKLHRASNECTIYKRLHDKRVMLKSKLSRNTLSKFKKVRFPISLRDKEKRFKYGLKECVSKGVVKEYPPIKEKSGEYIARVKFTVIVKNNPILIIGRSANAELAKLA